MAILIEILILIVFSHLDRSLTRAGDSVLTTLVSRHASDAWQCNVRQCCTIFREGAYILAVWNFPQNLVLVSAFYEYLKTLSSITYMFGWGGALMMSSEQAIKYQLTQNWDLPCFCSGVAPSAGQWGLICKFSPYLIVSDGDSGHIFLDQTYTNIWKLKWKFDILHIDVDTIG